MKPLAKVTTSSLWLCCCLGGLLGLLSERSSAQVYVQGRVFDSAARPVAFAQVQLLLPSAKLPYEFGQSTPKGTFRLKAKPGVSSTLEIRALGLETFSLTVQAPNGPEGTVDLGGILLQPHYQEIHEVHVEGFKPLERRKDTMVYRVAAFAQGNEKSIGEVINKMPGLKVTPEGAITYLGREVEKVMVSGADMFGRGYQMLTRNLNPNAVQEVQVLEHFEENRFLRSMRKSERVAINLELGRGKGQVMGTIRGAYGYRHAHDAQLSLVGVFSHLQWSLLANSNQVGSSPIATNSGWMTPTGLSDMAGGELARLSQSNASALAFITKVQGASAPIRQARSRRNMSHMLSLGSVYTPSSKFRLKANVAGQFENDRFNNQLHSQVRVRGLDFTRDQLSARKEQNALAGARLTLDGQLYALADWHYDGGYAFTNTQSHAVTTTHAATLDEQLRGVWQRTDHTFLYTQSFDSLGILRGGLFWQSQWMLPTYTATATGRVPVGLIGAEPVSTDYQQADHTGQMRWIYLAPTRHGFSGNIQLGGIFSQFNLHAHDYWTHATYHGLQTAEAYLGGALSYTYGPFKALLNLVAQTNRQMLLGEPTSPLPHWKLFPVPSLTLQVSSGPQLGVLSYSYNTTASGLLEMLPDTLLTGFRFQQQGRPGFHYHYGHNLMAFYSYGLPTARLAFQAWLLYNINLKPITTATMLSANRSLTILVTGRKHDMLLAKANVDFYIAPLFTNLRLFVEAQRSHYGQWINENYYPLTHDHLYADLSLRTAFQHVVDIMLGATWETSYLRGHDRTLLHSMTQYADLIFNIGPVQLRVTGDRQEVGLTKMHDNAIYFLDAELQWTLLRKHLTLFANGRNILNSTTYAHNSTNLDEQTHMRYAIAPLQVMLGAMWQF